MGPLGPFTWHSPRKPTHDNAVPRTPSLLFVGLIQIQLVAHHWQTCSFLSRTIQLSSPLIRAYNLLSFVLLEYTHVGDYAGTNLGEKTTKVLAHPRYESLTSHTSLVDAFARCRQRAVMLYAKKEEKGEKSNVDAELPTEVVKVSSSRDELKTKDLVPWSRRLNPLKTNQIPPVPEERQPSKEQDANWLSKLTFHWVTPILSVSAGNPNPSWPKAYVALAYVPVHTRLILTTVLGWVPAASRSKRHMASEQESKHPRPRE